MRRLILLLAVLTPFALPALAAPACTGATDQSAYEILALRQMMTVLATKCSGRETDYNQIFVKRFQPALQANYRTVQGYFRRIYGNMGQGRMDTFTTDLVNVMSHQANIEGGEFCARTGLIVNEMAALRSMEELASYAAAKDFSPPGMSMCPVVAARRR